MIQDIFRLPKFNKTYLLFLVFCIAIGFDFGIQIGKKNKTIGDLLWLSFLMNLIEQTGKIKQWF